MEFLIGTIVAFAGIYIVRKTTLSNRASIKKISLRFSQSKLYDITKDLVSLDGPSFPQRKPRQSTEFEKKNSTRIVYMDDQAWWIENGALVVAGITPEGMIDFENKKGVDTFTMDKVQLDKTIFIVEKLTEGL
jgi:hypothetical protein